MDAIQLHAYIYIYIYIYIIISYMRIYYNTCVPYIFDKVYKVFDKKSKSEKIYLLYIHIIYLNYMYIYSKYILL